MTHLRVSGVQYIRLWLENSCQLLIISFNLSKKMAHICKNENARRSELLHHS